MKLEKSLINNDEINNLITKYSLKDIQIYKVLSGIKLIVSFVYVKNEVELKNNWEKINNVLSEYLEDFIEENFVRWNIYIVYLVDDEVSKELQYKIENDTFFARKIVEDNYRLDLSEKNIKKLISKHISFDDLDIKGTVPCREPYSSDSLVYKKLSDVASLTDNKIDSILLLLEKDDYEV